MLVPVCFPFVSYEIKLIAEWLDSSPLAIAILLMKLPALVRIEPADNAAVRAMQSFFKSQVTAPFKFARKRQESRRRLVAGAESFFYKCLRVSGLFSKGVVDNFPVRIPDLFTYKHYN